MPLGPKSDAVVKLCKFVRLEGFTLVPTTANPKFLHVIVKGTVR